MPMQDLSAAVPPHSTINTGEMSNTATQMQPPQKPRAQRFPIQIPMRYRTSCEPDWSDATTVNISRSGMLFHAEKALQLQTVLEILMELPTEIAGELPANVICCGPVVRSDPPLAAVSIVHYRFAPHDHAPDR
jgi:hypothetical protein